MKAIKFLTMTLAMLMLSVVFPSCSDDDDPVEVYDYYIEWNVSGGGLDSSKLDYMESELNLLVSDLDLYSMDKEDAVYVFDYFLQQLQWQFSAGIAGVEGTLKITLTLMTTEGTSVTTATLNITSTGCTIG